MTWEAEDELYRQLGSRMVALASVTVGPSAAADVVSQTVEELLKRGRWAKANDPAAYAMRAVVFTSQSYVRGESRRRLAKTVRWEGTDRPQNRRLPIRRPWRYYVRLVLNSERLPTSPTGKTLRHKPSPNCSTFPKGVGKTPTGPCPIQSPKGPRMSDMTHGQLGNVSSQESLRRQKLDGDDQLSICVRQLVVLADRPNVSFVGACLSGSGAHTQAEAFTTQGCIADAFGCVRWSRAGHSSLCYSGNNPELHDDHQASSQRTDTRLPHRGSRGRSLLGER